MWSGFAGSLNFEHDWVPRVMGPTGDTGNSDRVYDDCHPEPKSKMLLVNDWGEGEASSSRCFGTKTHRVGHELCWDVA